MLVYLRENYTLLLTLGCGEAPVSPEYGWGLSRGESENRNLCGVSR